MRRFQTAEEAEYLRHQEECLALAFAAVSEPQRIMLSHIADTWLRLAEGVREDIPSSAVH